MKISLKWLKRILPELNQSTETIVDALTTLGIEVDSVTRVGVPQEHLVVGQVLHFEGHPNADKLRVCEVDTGNDRRTIVCGAKNFHEGDYVAVALPGCAMPDGFTIQEADLRGVRSCGMLCSARELHLSNDHDGILILEKNVKLGTPVASLFSSADTILELELTANRGDCMSHWGVARELAAYFQCALEIPEASVFEANENANSSFLLKELKLSSPDCHGFLAWGISDVKVEESPDWLRRDLENLGMRSVNNVVDVTNWLMMETGQPLHVFDADKIAGGCLEIRQAHDGEKITALNHKSYELTPEMMVIADSEKPLVIAGIMGSEAAEVDTQTRNIVLEVASFRPESIQKTSRALGLTSDASQRFARGVDSAYAYTVGQRAVQMISELAGGKADMAPRSVGSFVQEGNDISLSAEFVQRIIGVEIPREEIQQLLHRLHFKATPTDSGWQVKVPSFRKNAIQLPIDLVQEILRLYNSDCLPRHTPRSVFVMREDARSAKFLKSSQDALLSLGYTEAYHYSTRAKEELESLFDDVELNALSNPLNAEQTHLRMSLLPGLLDALSLNQRNGQTLNRVFETGRVWCPINGKLAELIAVSWAAISPENRPWNTPSPVDFYEMKAVVQSLATLAGLALKDSLFATISNSRLWQPDYAAQAGKLTPFGYQAEVGLLNLPMTRSWSLDSRVYAGEILLLPSIFERKTKHINYKPFNNFPSITRDLSVVVPEQLSGEEVRCAVEKCIKKVLKKDLILENVSIVDIYRGKPLNDEEKSFTVRWSVASQKETLSEEAAQEIFANVLSAVEKLPNYRIRS